MEKIEYVKVNKVKFEIAIKDIKEVAEFLDGIALMVDKDRAYGVTSRAHKLTNAIQWLHNWGDDESLNKGRIKK